LPRPPRSSAISIEISSKLIATTIVALSFLSLGANLQHSPLGDAIALGLTIVNTLLVLAGWPMLCRHRLAAPLRPLTTKIQRLLAGDRDIRFAEGTSTAEIAELAQPLGGWRLPSQALREQAAHEQQQAHDRVAEQAQRRRANPKDESLFGYSPGELIGRHLTTLIPASTRADYDGLCEALRQPGQRPLCKRLLGARKDGSELTLEASLSLLPEPPGRPLQLCAMLRDITVRQPAEPETPKARALTEEAGRAKADLLANLSHEIRTPMNSIIGLTHLVLQTRLDAFLELHETFREIAEEYADQSETVQFDAIKG
jgi:PAS domain S-box-containing protein